MICFDVYLNGEKICRAGKEDLTVMNCIVSYCRASEHYPADELRAHIGGLFANSGANIHPRWADDLELKTGDEVTIRIVDADTADEPSAEVAYTAEDYTRRERAYFERLRAKYEKEN